MSGHSKKRSKFDHSPDADDDDSDGLGYLMGDSENDDDDDNNDASSRRRKTWKSKTNQRGDGASIEDMESELQKLPTLTTAQRHEALAKIPSDNDKNLQRLFWEFGCNFVMHEHQFKGVRMMAGVQETFPGGMVLNMGSLASAEPRRQGERGILVADVMGLGKTVQAVMACLLRNKIAEAQGKPNKPTIIMSPNDSVLNQWHEHLILAGVDRNTIKRFRTKQSQPIEGGIFVLCNRYDLQTEASLTFRSMKGDAEPSRSVLFRSASDHLLRVLQNQYGANNFKVKNKYVKKREKITIDQCITNHLSKEYQSDTAVAEFRTVVIDEAHFLKNLKTYWGMAAALLGLHTERILPMTGTPYNNNCQDLATLMNFINPTEPWATVKWWKAATQTKIAPLVAKALAEWSQNCLLRRDKDVIADKLPLKTVRKVQVPSCPGELKVYEVYEEKLHKIFGLLTSLDASGKGNSRRYRILLEQMFRLAACCRMALVHPALPSGGREVTVFFSPTRSKMQSVLSGLEQKDLCVVCGRRAGIKLKAGNGRGKFQSENDELPSEDDDDPLEDDQTVGTYDDMVSDDDSESEDSKAKNEGGREGEGKPIKFKQGTGKIVALPSSWCQLAARGIRHFACESCIDELEESKSSCPRCCDLFGRLDHTSSDDGANEEADGEPTPLQLDQSEEDTKLADGAPPRKLHCEGVFGGFRSTAKLDNVISDFKSKLPHDEKVLIVSFFKGTLDLLEAIFAELNVEVARFDGDIKSDQRERVLHRFKTKDSCRVLLMTVQTGGTGLNLVVANHVWFVDRFWNPMVMEQCEDRCYRLGQERDVGISYFDVRFTIDDVFHHINNLKMENAALILADGTKLSKAGMSFRELSGKLGKGVGRVRLARERFHRGEDPSGNRPWSAAGPVPPLGTGTPTTTTSGSGRSPMQVWSNSTDSTTRMRDSRQSATVPPLASISIPNVASAAWTQRLGSSRLEQPLQQPTTAEQLRANRVMWADRNGFSMFEVRPEMAPSSVPAAAAVPDRAGSGDLWNGQNNAAARNITPHHQLRTLIGNYSLEDSVCEFLLKESNGDVNRAAAFYKGQKQVEAGKENKQLTFREKLQGMKKNKKKEPEVIVID